MALLAVTVVVLASLNAVAARSSTSSRAATGPADRSPAVATSTGASGDADTAAVPPPTGRPTPVPLVTAMPEPLVTAMPDPLVTAMPRPHPVAPSQGSRSEPTFPLPIKGVWVHVLDDTLLSRASIAQMLDAVVAGGANTVVVEVARRFDAYYASSFLPRANDPGFEPGLDVLAEVVAGADARGLSVHAWMTAMPAWTPETAKYTDPQHWLFTAYGRDVPPAQSWLTFTAEGAPTDFLDPGHPEVQNLVVATAAELARYDIDAVHLDYLRYPAADTGYNPVALGRFQAETGRSDIPAPEDPQFGDWRRQQTTDLLRRVRHAVQQIDPTVGVSAALIAWGDGPAGGRTFEQTPAWYRVFQPWPSWVAEGLVDVAMPMLYFRETQHAAFHRNWMSYVAGLRSAGGVIIAPGQGSWLNDVDASLAQLGAAAPFVDGEVLFSYQQTAADLGQSLLPALAGSLWHPERLEPATAAGADG